MFVNIAIILETAEVPAQALMQLQGMTGRRLHELRATIVQGKPLYEEKILLGDVDENVALLRKFLAELKDLSLPIRVYDLLEDETMESCSRPEENEISLEVLRNGLNSIAEQGLQEYN